MKKICTTFIFCLLLISFTHGQNLVMNPSLEAYITCPGFGQFSNTYIKDWDKPSYGSTDYYHYNCPGIIPSQQIPKTGAAYAGIIGYNYGQEYREYMTGTLTTPLIPGATYYCEFYVSLHDGYIQAINEIGAYFSAASPGPFTNTLHIAVTPQIENNVNLLDDTSMWMRVSGYFLASGGEQYITIGNFNNDSNTTIVQVGSSGSFGSYYFVDDVWVSLSEGLSAGEVESESFLLYPNPFTDKITFSPAGNVPHQLEIRNLTGQKVFSAVVAQHEEIDLSFLSPGFYHADIISGERLFRKTIVRVAR